MQRFHLTKFLFYIVGINLYITKNVHSHQKYLLEERQQWKINPYPLFKVDSYANDLAGHNINFHFSNPDGSYHFGYNDLDRDHKYNFREEMRHPTGRVNGRYGYSEGDGNFKSYEYIADINGFRIWPLNFEEILIPDMQPSTSTTTENPLRVDVSEVLIIGPIPKPWSELVQSNQDESM